MRSVVSISLIIFFCFFYGCRNGNRPLVRADADKIHNLIKAGDFGKVYEAASSRIKECYTNDRFSEQMALLAKKLRASSPELVFLEDIEESTKIDAISSSTDKFFEGIYIVGDANSGMREVLTFTNEDSGMKLFSYRVFDRSKNEDVRSDMIACAQKD